MSRRNPQVYMDFQVGTAAAGRVIFELFTDITPKTAENFRGLCTGEYGNVGMGKKTKKLHYLGTPIHRVVDNTSIQGGDIINGDGTGGCSIYGGNFVDENFQRRHACAGLLSMANKGRNTNTSQFFVTLKPCPHLDGKHVVFGQVIDGMEVIRKVAKVPVDMSDRPKIPVTIVNCGEVNDPRNFLNYDPFKKQIFDEIQEQKKKLYGQDDEQSDEEGQQNEEKEEQRDGEIENPDEGDEVKQPPVDDPIINKISTSQKKRLDELRQQIQKARIQNDKAVLEEEKRNTDANYDNQKKRKHYLERKDQEAQELEFKGIDSSFSHLLRTQRQRTEEEDQLRKKKEYFGWDVFNDESVYNAYKKRCTTLVKNNDAYSQQMQQISNKEEVYNQQLQKYQVQFQPSEEAIERLAVDINKQIEKRKAFSRRRPFNEDEPVTYINERNRIFNKKLQRNFGAYAADIKANLERGTAN